MPKKPIKSQSKPSSYDQKTPVRSSATSPEEWSSSILEEAAIKFPDFISRDAFHGRNGFSEEEWLSYILEEAAIKFPDFISRDAFHGRITDIEPENKAADCKLWMSESSMVASSVFPGSLVSVSLAASIMNFSNGSLLNSFADGLGRHFGVDVGNDMASDVGSYFALAVVFPSCKVLKNGVRLSWSLSCTMGCPSVGRNTFVFPIESYSISRLPNGANIPHSSTNTKVSNVSPHKCTDLYLKLVPLKNGLMLYREGSSPTDILSETGRGQSGVRNNSSPKTPSCFQSKLTSPVSNQLLLRSKGSLSGLDPSDRTSANLSATIMALEDEKVKELLQNYAVRWLYSRSLLYGNHVALPICGQIRVFRVEAASGQDKANKIQINSINNVDAAIFVDSKTKIHFSSMPLTLETPDKGGLPELSNGDSSDKETRNVPKLGGLSEEFAVMKEIINSSLIHKDTIMRLGLQTTKGVLLYGPPGTGKTSLARTSARDAGVNLFSVNGPEVISQYYGESEQALHAVFDSAKRAIPAMVFIDELDAIAPARSIGSEELSQRMVATLLNLMDGISRNDGVLVIAATNRPDSIDPALRRPGRFDREIEIGVPSPKQRLDIMLTLLSEMDHSLADAEVRSLALTTHGFVGADLAALCNEAALITLQRYIKFKNSNYFSGSFNQQLEEAPLKFDGFAGNMGASIIRYDDMATPDMLDSVSLLLSNLTVASEPALSSDHGEKARLNVHTVQDAFCVDKGDEASIMVEDSLLKVSLDDFEKAKMKVRPSAMREVMLEVPNVCWEDIGGQKEVKKQLIEAVEWPQKHQDAFNRIGTRPPTGVLLFGPPGCSKTLMARAVASKAGLNFLAVKGPELFSKWVGESEKAVKSLFAKARAAAPSIIFFDEIDGLAVIRGNENTGASVADRVMSQLLVELDGLNQRVGVTVIAATNRPDKIDLALLRPGRFDRLLYVGPPNADDREEIFHIHLRKMPCASDVSKRDLADLTEGYTGADIYLICREAAIVALEENLDILEISMSHFKVAIGRVPSSEVLSYEEFSTKFQRLVSSSTT